METPSVLAGVAVAAACLFVVTMALANRPTTMIAGEYVGTSFHFLLLPLIAAVPLGVVGQGTGLAWVVCDVIAGTGLIWTASSGGEVAAKPVFAAVRMAGHLFAAIWIAMTSWRLDAVGLTIGALLAFSFAAYTLAAGRMPEKALAVPGLLMVGWLLLLARNFLGKVA